MRINDVEDVGGITLRFILSDKFEKFNVSYFRIEKKVLCESCARTRCEHVQFMISVLNENPTWQTQDFVYDCCEVRLTFEEIQTMRTAFSTYNAEIVQDPETENPKDPPSPFSMIEVDE